jgi:hypothetical protein
MALGVSVRNEREERARVAGSGGERRRGSLRVKEAIGEQPRRVYITDWKRH